MMCYKDKWFCTFYKECISGDNCDRALTDTEIEKAIKWWGNKNFPYAKYIFFNDVKEHL